MLVRGPLTSQEGLLGARMHSVGGFIAFFDAQEGRMGGFRTPIEGRLTTAPPGMLRFREANECLVCVC